MLIKQKKHNKLDSRAKILEGIALGERAIRENRIVTHAEVKERLNRFYKDRRE